MLGAHVVLENAYKHGVRWFIHIFSAEVYGTAKPDPNGLEEIAPLSPLNAYGGSKAFFKVLVKLYGNKGGMITRIVRPSIVYGPKQFPDSLFRLADEHFVSFSLFHDPPLLSHSSAYDYPSIELIPKSITLLQTGHKVTTYGNGEDFKR